MIRLILRDLFPGRSAVGALRQRVHELERENARLRDQEQTLIEERDDARGDVEKLSAEVDALQKRGLRPTPTPGEARMLEIVRANPGLIASNLALIAFRSEAFKTTVSDAARPLQALHKKSLVRRERSGNTYRYWATT